MLGWTGSEGERTDVVAHVLGFLMGTGLGVVAALPWGKRVLGRVPQWAAGLAALAIISVAWVLALRS
jgi:hypothetical protein